MILATQFLNIALAITFLALALGQVMSMVRLVLGPTSGDRVLALDTMVINALGLVIVLGIFKGVQIYFEVALLIAMLGFVSTVALARFILRGDIIE
ncbi:multisubunit potassium/proton antiporter PhaF subunit [Loktanella sp. PT4BL]|jgi:multicomponent K+:H+ antiporter subunit F|uniref:Multisubunit potassium/proton antiporter, PhaF subunit n=1 Tax=Yoonia rosea TaxID=287098 RepID=A0A1R3WAR9_9RHOB|nr:MULTISPECIES: K+/H+ antiporter subunit F [Rhodobacterales]KQB97423.1 cation:proton antiporter [Loktanella sp. 1ANDIMAR09]PXW71050.1 multisubunit potassium/proton antiporter PhaF subunit [Loktanella sp. PT4BL]SIT74396.1 multisubunit potassium/proton antiporter, PhaF subunit [Yoonia rosea]